MSCYMTVMIFCIFYFCGGVLLIGFRPFVEACIDAAEKGEALKYIPKLADPRERAEVSRPCAFFSCPSCMCYSSLLFRSPLLRSLSDFYRHMLGLAWPRKLLMLLLRQKMVNCLVDWNWVLHKIQLLHQFLTLYEIDCPSKEFHSDLKLHIPFLLLWVLSLLYVWCAYSLFHVDLYELSLQCVHTVDAYRVHYFPCSFHSFERFPNY